MTTLLIDFGNTALKWSTKQDPDNPISVVHHGMSSKLESTFKHWEKLQPGNIIGCSVASEHLAFIATQFFKSHHLRWEWVKAHQRYQGDFELINNYKNPKQLGADRWYAAIGAIVCCPNKDLLVAHVGTATTVDSISFNGTHYVFEGGRIAPGPVLMRSGLQRGIPSLSKDLGEKVTFPRSTKDAISTGIIDAQVGLIAMAIRKMELRGLSPQLILAGGAAQLLAPYIQEVIPSVMVKHNLVLQGLAKLTDHQN